MTVSGSSLSHGESYQSYTITYDGNCGFFIGPLYEVEEVPFGSKYVQCFYNIKMEGFVSNATSAPVEMIMNFCPLFY